MWPDWAIYFTLGNFLKPVAAIFSAKSPIFLGSFGKGVFNLSFFYWYHLLGNFYRHLATFYWSHWFWVIQFVPFHSLTICEEAFEQRRKEKILNTNLMEGNDLFPFSMMCAYCWSFWMCFREPWSSGYVRRLMLWRLWVWIPVPYTGWTLFIFVCCIKYFVWPFFVDF